MLLEVFRKVPVSRLLLPYVAGMIFLQDSLHLSISFLLLGAWGLGMFRYLERHMPSAWSVRWLPGVCFCLLWASLGGFQMQRLNRKSAFPEPSRPFMAEIKLIGLPAEKTKSIQVKAQVEATEPGFESWEGKQLMVYVPKSTEPLAIANRYRVCLQPRLPQPPPNPYAFDFGSWLRHQGLCGTCYVNELNLLSKAGAWNIRAASERIRQILLSRFRQTGIQGSELALVSALVLGETSLLNAETKADFSISGISHILSVSGLHVAVVYALLAFLLSFLGRFKYGTIPKQLLIILLLFFYAFVTGMSPSVLRSAFMFSLLVLGKCLHRRSHTLNTVLFSAFVLLLWNPGFIYDLGFQLSYLAVFFIVVVHPRLVAWWSPSSKPVKYLWEMLCLSLVAQLGTAPLTVRAFHTFPNYFLLNNLLAVPFSSLLIYLALAFLMAGGIPVLGTLLSQLLNSCLHGFLLLVDGMGDLPHALTRGLYPDWTQMLGFYWIILAFFVSFLLKRRSWFIPFLASLLCFQLLSIARDFWW